MTGRTDNGMRTCTGCGGRALQRELVRFQVGTDGSLQVVARARAGRSSYVHRRRECVEGITSRRLLRRSLRMQPTVKAKEDLVEFLLTRIVE